MDWLKQLIKNNPHFAISIPTMMSFADFLGNLLIAISDGELESNEMHQLLSSANGFETFLLLIIIVALKEKKK